MSMIQEPSIQVSFDQIVFIVGTIFGVLTGVIATLAKWIMDSFKSLNLKLEHCEKRHEESNVTLNTVIERAASLEGRVQEMQRMDPAVLATTIATAVIDAMHKTRTQ